MTLSSVHTIGIIVGRDLVGDALIKLPFLRALRAAFPDAKISWITSQGPTAYSTALRNVTSHLIDAIYEMPEWVAEARDQRIEAGEKESLPLASDLQPLPPPFFDLLIDSRNRWRMALEAKKIPHKVFIAPAMRYLFSDKRPPLFSRKPPHMTGRLMQLVELASGRKPTEITGRLPVDADLLARARQILPEGHTYIGFAPGAGNRIKAWPRYKFEKAAIAEAAKGRIPVFLLGPQELSWHNELIHAVPNAKFPLQDHATWGTSIITIEQTLAIGTLLAVAVVNDSGTGHMLAAVDCPLISLFGPTSPEKLAPRVTHGMVIKAQNYAKGGGSAENMNNIHWEVVVEAIESCVLWVEGGRK